MKYAFESVVVETDTFDVFLAGDRIRLEPKVFSLLKFLIENRERVVTKADLVDGVWDGRFISDATISSAIKALRQALGDDGRNQRIIRTAHGQGFRFVARVFEQETDKKIWTETKTDIPEYRDEINYCMTDDGVSLAYTISGSGFPIVKVANWLSHVEYDWESPIWAHFLRFLTEDNTLLRYDERGNGMSDWEVEDFTLDRLLDDLETVINASGFDKFILYGVSQGCAISAAYTARHPERVAGQILYGGYSRGWKRRKIPEEKEKRTAMTQLIRIGWGEDNPAFRRIFASLFVPDADIEQIEWYTDLQSKTTTGKNAANMDESLADLDVSAVLPEVSVPSLVLHCEDDAVVPFKEGQRLAQLIPTAKFIRLSGHNHILLETEPAWVDFKSEIKKFLGEISTAHPEM